MSKFKEGVRSVLAAMGVLRSPAPTAEAMSAEPPARVSPGSAAGMSSILALAALFTVFLPGWAAGSIGADPWGFLYALAVFLGGEFFAGLVAILGLAPYARGVR